MQQTSRSTPIFECGYAIVDGLLVTVELRQAASDITLQINRTTLGDGLGQFFNCSSDGYLIAAQTTQYVW